METRKIRHPLYGTIFPKLHLLFGLEFILFLITFVCLKGYNFFQNDFSDSIIISVGMLTFISVFFGFIFKEGQIFLASFHSIINQAVERLKGDLFWKEIDRENITKKDMKDVKKIKKSINELSILANPHLWFWITTFTFVFSMIISIIEIPLKSFIVSLTIQLGILFTLFFLTAILSIQTAHKIETESNERVRKILESQGIKYNPKS